MTGNFIIVGTQRTGSTAFFRVMNLHPDIACGREWAHDIPPHRKLAAVKRGLAGDFSDLSDLSRKVILKEYNNQVKWLGFKWLFRSSDKWLVHPRYAPALWVDRFDVARRWIASTPEMRVIHIVRDNPLDWLKSKYLASKTGLFAKTPYPEDTKVQVPVNQAVKRITTKQYIDESLSQLASTNPYLMIHYEDFARSNEQTVARAIDFLGCDVSLFEFKDKPRPKKQSKGRASDYISNWSDVEDALTKAGLYAPLPAGGQ